MEPPRNVPSHLQIGAIFDSYPRSVAGSRSHESEPLHVLLSPWPIPWARCPHHCCRSVLPSSPTRPHHPLHGALLPFLLLEHLCTRPPDACMTTLLRAGHPYPLLPSTSSLAPHMVHVGGPLTEHLSSGFKDAVTQALEGNP